MDPTTINEAVRLMKGAQRQLSETVRARDNAEREVRHLSMENKRLRTALDIAHQQLATFDRPSIAAAPLPSMMGARHG